MSAIDPPADPLSGLSAGSAQAYRRLTGWVAERARRGGCPVFGINGAQGSGKSTLAASLRDELHSGHGLRAAVLSIDDFYLPRAERQRLAREVHPLFATRGVPGTHEVELGVAILERLRRLGTGARLALPTFSKADDDRQAEHDWPSIEGPVDLILFEGWCVGTPAEDEAALREPVNELEAWEDADGRWRRAVNARLAGGYARWFAKLDALIFLQVPGFDSIARWRGQQERETAARAGGKSRSGLMNEAQLARFIQHYERLTRHALAVLPDRADALLRLDEDHAVVELRLGG